MNNKKIIFLRIILVILIILWMIFVFGFSSQGAEESSGLSHKIATFFTSDIEMQKIIEPYIRKIAHYSEYGLGGCLFFSFFSTFKMNEKIRIFLACILGIIYACTDEFHQLYVPGRSGLISDVYIDSLGVITGVLIMKLFIMIKKLVCKEEIKC